MPLGEKFVALHSIRFGLHRGLHASDADQDRIDLGEKERPTLARTTNATVNMVTKLSQPGVMTGQRRSLLIDR